MWICYIVVVLCVTVIKATEDISLIISASSKNGTPVLAQIFGHPDDLVYNLTQGQSLEISALEGNPSTMSFHKLAFHYGRQQLFYNNAKEGDIEVLHMSTSLTGTLHLFTSTKIGGITIDWVSNNIYWTDQVYNWILMSSLEGNVNSYYKVVDQGLDEPGSIIVHPATSQLFWTDFGKQPKVERSDLLGGDRTTIVSTSLVRPAYLVIDYKTASLYWVDIGQGNIGRSDLSGKRRSTFFEAEFLRLVTGFTLFEGYMFAISDEEKSLYVLDISIPDDYLTSTLEYDRLYDIQIYTGSNQPESPSGCPAKCKGLCARSKNNTNTQCACPQGQELLFNTYCQDIQYIESPLYMYTLENALCRYHVWTPVMTDQQLAHNCLANFTKSGDYFLGQLFEQKYLYVASEENIQRVLMKGGSSFETVVRNVGNLKGFSVDWISNNIYWTESESIMVANANGQYMHQLLTSLKGVNGLAVDPVSGYLFYTSIYPDVHIGRAFLNGESRSIFVSSSLQSPEQLVVDYHDNRLYWADSIFDRIESIKTDGTGRIIVINLQDSIPFGIATFQDHLVWTDKGLQTPGIHWTYKDGTGDVIRSTLKAKTTGTILLYGDYSQPDGYPNACSSNNGWCSHICLPSPTDKTCHCGVGYVLHDDGQTCVSDIGAVDSALVLVDAGQKAIFQMDLDNYDISAIPVSDLGDHVAIDVDIVSKLIFWTDISGKSIKKSTLTGQDVETVLSLSEDSKPEGLAVDWISQIIFYTDGGKGHIGRVIYKGKQHQTLIQHLDYPIGITLDFTNRRIYWTDRGIVPKIETATYDGQDRRTIVSNQDLGWPNGITLDRREEVLYWCDGRLSRIESIRADGTDRKLIYLTSESVYFGIVLRGDYLYFTSLNKGGIQRLHKDDGVPEDVGDHVISLGKGIAAYDVTDIPTTVSTSTSSTTSRVGTADDRTEPSTHGTANNNVFIIIGISVAGVIFLTAILTVGIYCCLTKKSKTTLAIANMGGRMGSLPGATGLPPPYSPQDGASGGIIKEDFKRKSSIYDFIPENPYITSPRKASLPALPSLKEEEDNQPYLKINVFPKIVEQEEDERQAAATRYTSLQKQSTEMTDVRKASTTDDPDQYLTPVSCKTEL